MCRGLTVVKLQSKCVGRTVFEGFNIQVIADRTMAEAIFGYQYPVLFQSRHLMQMNYEKTGGRAFIVYSSVKVKIDI